MKYTNREDTFPSNILSENLDICHHLSTNHASTEKSKKV